MYIFKNSLISISRNKGRNFLIAVIIIVISCTSTIALAIKNTAENIVEDYEKSNDIIATVSFNRKNLSANFKGGEDARKENIELFNNIKQLSLEDVKKYGDSENLKGYNYVYSTSLNSESLTKASDTYEYEVQDTQTSKSTTTSTTGTKPDPGDFNGRGKPPEGYHTTTNINTTTIITKSMEKFQSNRNFIGDFQLDGYSSYNAMSDFAEGIYTVSEGEMISNFNEMECIINSELATLNNVEIGSTITLKNSNNDKSYEFKVVGFYKENSNNDDSKSMYSKAVNTIITGSQVVEKIASEDESIITSINPSFIIKDEESIEKFEQELKEKGLSEYYTISTNIEELKKATKSISNVKTFAITFLLITFAIATVILFVINMINIRERKYEIGVFRTIGLSKVKLTLQFVLELLFVAIISLVIGALIGATLTKPVGNHLLQNEISENEASSQEIANNFGDEFDKSKIEKRFNGEVYVQKIEKIDAVVNYIIVLQMLGIGVALVFVSSIASMISIQRFSPLTILKERS